MPQSTRYRYWCKTCNGFALHTAVDDINTDEEAKLLCQCGTIYTPIKIKDIPQGLIAEQRVRFKEFRKRQLAQSFGLLSMMGALGSFGSFGHGESSRIIEGDAGLKHEEEVIEARRKVVKEEKRLEVLKYRDTGRNDVCLCGSGLKYKKCCLFKHK